MVKKRSILHVLHGNSARNFTRMSETNTYNLGKGCTLFRWLGNRIQQYKPWIIGYYIYHMSRSQKYVDDMKLKYTCWPRFISEMGYC